MRTPIIHTERIIEYLRYFIEYLDDDTIKDFISLVFEKKDFFISPFVTYKDFFVYLIVKNYAKLISYENNTEYNELLQDEKRFSKLYLRFSLLRKKLYYSNDYCKLINECEIENSTNNQDINYDNLFINIKESEHKILACIGNIADSIDSYIVKINSTKNISDFKKFFKYAVKRIIQKKFCYVIGNYYKKTNSISFDKRILVPSKSIGRINYNINKRGTDFILVELPSEKEEVFNNFLELYENLDIDIKSYKKLNNVIDKTIDKLNKNKKIKNYCHICYSLNKNNKKQKCKNCERIYELIHEIDSFQTTNSIGGRIKRRIVEEKDLSNEEKKERHRKNLLDFVKKLEKDQNNGLLQNVNKNLNTEKFEELYRIIDNTFGKYRR